MTDSTRKLWGRPEGHLDNVDRWIIARDDSPETAEFLRSKQVDNFKQNLMDGPLAEGVSMNLKGRVCWSASRGWLEYTGKVWQSRRIEAITEIVRLEMKDLYTELSKRVMEPEEAKRSAILLSRSKVKAVTDLLPGMMEVPEEYFDAMPDLLNTLNGVVDLRTGDMIDHFPGQYFTKITKVAYLPGETHPLWDAALEALPDDAHDYLQVRYGQAATGYTTDDDVLPIQTGGGSNGKSTIVQAALAALGDFGTVVPEKVLLANPGEHPTELMNLRGARFAVIEETPEGHRLPTKRLKDLLGTPVITARAMRQDFVSWNATHTLVLNTNYVPQVAETDHGTWRRLALIRFPYRFIDASEPLLSATDRHGIPGLRERLLDNRDDELVAVLAWIVKGAIAWFEMQQSQLPMPESVRRDTDAWRAESDLVLAYANDRLIFDPSGSVVSKELYEDFSDWLRASGRQAWSDQTFTARFGGHMLSERNHVEKARVNKPRGLTMRYPQTAQPDSKTTIWKGVRFTGPPSGL